MSKVNQSQEELEKLKKEEELREKRKQENLINYDTRRVHSYSSKATQKLPI